MPIDRLGRQQLDHHLQQFPRAPPAEFRDEDCRAQPERNGDGHGERGHRRRSGEQGEDAELRTDRRLRAPVRAREELGQVELAEHDGRRFAGYEIEDGDDERDRAPAAHPDRDIDRRLGAAVEEAMESGAHASP